MSRLSSNFYHFLSLEILQNTVKHIYTINEFKKTSNFFILFTQSVIQFDYKKDSRIVLINYICIL